MLIIIPSLNFGHIKLTCNVELRTKNLRFLHEKHTYFYTFFMLKFGYVTYNQLFVFFECLQFSNLFFQEMYLSKHNTNQLKKIDYEFNRKRKS
jgi:hypothetical protein